MFSISAGMLTRYRSRIRRSLRGCRPRLSLGLDLFEDGFSLDLFGFLIALPFLDRWRYEPHETIESWGFTVDFRMHYVYLKWGKWTKFIHPLGDWHHVRSDVMRPDGSLAKRVACYERGEPDGRWQESYPYHYCMRDWTVQERTATVHVEEREWRWRIFGFILPWPRKVHRYIEVEFSDEVGDRSGSWKGGCVGCGYDLRKNETPLECLRRMERERKF